MRIPAAILFAPNAPFVIDDVDLDGPRAGEVLVQVQAAGVCHSDYHLVTGDTKHPLPVVAGHEAAGIVVEAGPAVSSLRPGDRVILNWAPDCGSCFYCLRGKPNLCEAFIGPVWAGTMLDGTTRLRHKGRAVYHWCALAAFAPYAVVPQQSCVPVRADVPADVAALVGCAVATGAGAVLHTHPVRPGDAVAVFGCGGVGLSAILAARLAGATPVIAIDKYSHKLDIAKSCGATHALLADADLLAGLRALTAGRGADVVVEAVGLPLLQEIALGAVRPGGTLVLAGLAPMGTGTNLPGAVLVRQEKTVKGSYYGSTHPRRDFPALLDLFCSGQLPLDRLISRRYRLDQINDAVADMLSSPTARGIITF